jgi:hypothetical protein
MSDRERVDVNFDGSFVLKDGKGKPIKDDKGREQNIPWKSVAAIDWALHMASGVDGSTRRIATGKNYPGLTQQQLLHDTLIGTTLFPDGKPSASSNIKEQQRWARISIAFNEALLAEGHYEQITPTKRAAILTEILAQDVFIRRTDFGIDQLDTDVKTKAVAVDPEDRAAVYLPINEPQIMEGRLVYAASTLYRFPDDLGGGRHAPRKWMVNEYKMINADNDAPSDKELNHIWGIFVTEGAYAAMARISYLASK